jgi:hypothetical protein
MIRNPDASFDLALRLRTPPGAPLGEVFAFLSGLYFRGKLAYAQTFASPEEILVITPSDGLRPPETLIKVEDLERYASVSIAASDARYRDPLMHDLGELSARLEPGAEVILLGSVATDKYLPALAGAFGSSVRFPLDFLGRGDMSRGALLLRSVRLKRELEYGGLAKRLRGADLRPRAVRSAR